MDSTGELTIKEEKASEGKGAACRLSRAASELTPLNASRAVWQMSSLLRLVRQGVLRVQEFSASGVFSRKIRVTIWCQGGTSTSPFLRSCARCCHCFSPAWMRVDTLWTSAMERNSRRRNTTKMSVLDSKHESAHFIGEVRSGMHHRVPRASMKRLRTIEGRICDLPVIFPIEMNCRWHSTIFRAVVKNFFS